MVPEDVAAVQAQLGRPPRGLRDIAHRCACGNPDVVETVPRLDDGTPFPTTYYLTCPRAASAIGTLEESGLMREMQARLADDEDLRTRYAAAHEDYLARRTAIGAESGLEVPEIDGISAGGMPNRVKCLHVLVAHSLVAGPGVNPFGDEALALLPGLVEDAVPSMTTTRVAAVDCGTNSIRLLVADLDPEAGTLVELTRQMEIVRLGEGVDQTGRLSAAALDRTFAACDRYAEVIRAFGAERTRFVATSASRDATNRGVFVGGVRKRLGVEPEVVPGAEEAALSFAGATRELAGSGIASEPPYLVIDIGGGSTEFVVGNHTPLAALSVDIGCVRMTERHLVGDPPTAREIALATADVDAAIDRAANAVPLDNARTLVGLAGSVTTVAGIALGLQEYDSAAIHHSRIPAARVREIADDLLSMTRAERAAIPVMHPGRVDVIGAGALILARIVERAGLDDVLVSEHDILDGIAWSQVWAADD